MFLKYENWSESTKKLLYYIFSIFLILLAFKVACYFMPFLIALIIANLLEPLIKKIGEKTRTCKEKSCNCGTFNFF